MIVNIYRYFICNTKGVVSYKNVYAVQFIYHFRLRVAQTLMQFIKGTATVNSVISFIFRRWDPPGGGPSSSGWQESARDWGFNGITIQVSNDDTVRLALLSLNNTAKWALNSIQIYNSMERIENLIGQKLVYEFPIFYGRRRSIALLTRYHDWPLFWARWIRSAPSHRIS